MSTVFTLPILSADFYIVPPTERYFIPLCDGDLNGGCGKCQEGVCRGFWAGEGSAVTRGEGEEDTPKEVLPSTGRQYTPSYKKGIEKRVDMLTNYYGRQEADWDSLSEGLVSPLSSPQFLLEVANAGGDPEHRTNMEQPSMMGVMSPSEVLALETSVELRESMGCLGDTRKKGHKSQTEKGVVD